MPRRNGVRRANGKICIVIDSVMHTLTIPAFVALMTDALGVLQALQADGEAS